MKLKTITLVALMVFICNSMSYAQTEYQGNPLNLTEVVVIDSTCKKDVLYDRAKALCVTLFNNPSKVIQIDDKEKGVLSIKAVENYNENASDYRYKIHYTLTIAMKDGKYRYEIKDLILTGTRWSDFYSKWVDTYNDIITDADLSESFFNKQKKSGKKKIKPDSSYVVYREEAKVLISALSSIVKREMAKPNEIMEQEW